MNRASRLSLGVVFGGASDDIVIEYLVVCV